MNAWPHQTYAVEQTLRAIAAGQTRVLVTSPTGGGKTRIMCDLIDHWTDAGLKTALYTNRKLLVEQTSRTMTAAGIDHGTRAAGYDGDDHFFPVQVCSIQTENARVFKAGIWDLHGAHRVLIDEAHLQKSSVAQKIMRQHIDAGAAVVGLTATPIDLAEVYDHLIVAGTNSELRACGALVGAIHYGPDEPDLKDIKAPLGEDLTEKQAVKAMMRDGIFGRVLEWYGKINPDHRPTLLFAPGVAESVWFAQQFAKAGIPAAHIDGSDVYYCGQLHRSTREMREEVLADSKHGAVKVICNRFVMREGVNCPWLSHCILATILGSLQTYLQAGGRMLRACEGKTHATIQDHGGNYWRHGSLNDDRIWNLAYTSGMVSGLREDRMRNGKDTEPFRCPQCAKIVRSPVCSCGWKPAQWVRTRVVVQSDGQLKPISGDVFKPRRVSRKPNGPELWKRMYYRSLKGKGERTFKAAAALFAMENNWGWPDPKWPLMPKEPLDWYLLVKDVPRERLT